MTSPAQQMRDVGEHAINSATVDGKSEIEELGRFILEGHFS